MNKKYLRFILALIACGFLFSQNIFAIGSSDGYSGSQNSLQEFKRRLVEIMDDADFNNMGGTMRLYY